MCAFMEILILAVSQEPQLMSKILNCKRKKKPAKIELKISNHFTSIGNSTDWNKNA